MGMGMGGSTNTLPSILTGSGGQTGVRFVKEEKPDGILGVGASKNMH